VNNYISIANHLIGPGCPCFIIAEVGNAHDGSLGTAHAYIDAIARTGANAVKFQTHIAAAESTKAEQFRVPFSYQDACRYDYWKRLEFTQAQWAELADHAEERGLVFLSTPFSREAVEMLSGLVPAWKVGSGEVTNTELLQDIRTTDLPVLLSSGMASWEELDRAVASLKGSPLAVLQCTTAYPCTAEQVGLNVLDVLRQQYECPVGLSDHSGTIYASLAAATLGANILEVHVTLSRDCFGPDVSSSVTIDEMAELVKGVRFIERALGNELDKNRASAEMTALKQTFGKSLVAARDLPAGIAIQPSDLALKKPGTGIPVDRLWNYIGRELAVPLAADEMLREECLV
jgi:N,N'-diacetyllegionaminate synthase